jgi:hypothetical protein
MSKEDFGVGGTKLKAKTTLDEILAPAKRASTQTQAKVVAEDSRFASLQTNPYYSTVFSESLSAEEKNKALTALLIGDSTKEENRANTQALELFKEWLQAQREQMASKIISMSDTKNFSLLRDIYQDINKALDDFEGDIAPLTDIIDALFKLRSTESTVAALDEIKNDKINEEENQKQFDAFNLQFKQINETITSTKQEIAKLKTNKSLFGFGDVTKEAKAKIAVLELTLNDKNDELDIVNKKFNEFNQNKAAAVASIDPELAQAKLKLRELLDLSSPVHEERSKKLIASALNFVETSKEKVSQVRTHLGNMDNQISNLSDTNTQMSYIYAMLNDATKGAEVVNENIRDNLAVAKDGENTIEKLTRENKLRDLDEHITYLSSTAVDTVATMADLGTATIRIKGMEDSNRIQMQKAKDMQARGVAGVADRISTVIQAVGAAAISESSNMVGQNLQRITDSTNTILHKDSMRNALELGDRNKDMAKAIESLKEYGKVTEATTTVTKAGLAEMRSQLGEMEATMSDVADLVNKSYSAASDVVSGDNSSSSPNSAGTGSIKKQDSISAFPMKKVV